MQAPSVQSCWPLARLVKIEILKIKVKISIAAVKFLSGNHSVCCIFKCAAAVSINKPCRGNLCMVLS